MDTPLFQAFSKNNAALLFEIARQSIGVVQTETQKVFYFEFQGKEN
jgi:hypothetical protein